MRAVIIAGGKGTRLGRISEIIPKSLVPLNNKPLLAYQIAKLKRNGFKDITIIINHLGKKIIGYCGNGRRFGVKISYFQETRPLGTAGGIKLLEKNFQSDFLVVYGDVLFNLDFKRLLKYHRQKKSAGRDYAGTLVAHPNDHPFDSDLLETDEQGEILKFFPKPHPNRLRFKNLVNAGVYVLTPRIFRYIEKNRVSDFGKQVFFEVLKRKGVLFAYNTPEYLKDMGTPQRLKEVENDIRSGKFQNGSLMTKKSAIFLDRDGTINKETGDLSRVKDFALMPNSARAIKKINKSGYYAVVITNQPQVAKGFCSLEELSEIHKKMETLLAKEGAKLDAIYFCPHHPQKGFKGEVKFLKIVCDCRKPKTGMIRQAAKELNIDLKKSWIIGDGTRDAKLAENANIRFLGVKTGDGLKDGAYALKIEPEKYLNLLTAVDKILS